MAMISGKIPLGAVVTGTVSKAQSVVKTELVFSTRAEFPESGNSQYLYIAQDENVCYRFDKETGEYVSLGGNNSGESVEVDLSDYYKRDETDALLDKKLSEESVSAVALSGDYNDLENAPSELPASDVHEWAKAESKPGYTAEEVGADTKGAAENALETAKTYADGKADEALNAAKTHTDTRVAELINSAPSTLDTLGEIAAAMTENKDVVEALDEAIGTKANAAELSAHTGDKANPHGVTKEQIGLGNAENKSSAEILGELTGENVKTALGYTPSRAITTTETLTLTAADWADNSQTVECTLDTSKRNVIDVLPESVAAWAAAGVLGILETETGITFQCNSVPTANLYFRVTSMEVN